MPRRPQHACNAAGCPQLTSGRYCDGHVHLAIEDRRRADADRPQSQDRGYDSKWKRERAAFIAEHPVCADPFGRHPGEQRATKQVDHIIPHKGNYRLFWQRSNWQSLCASCGGYKSATEPGGRAEPGHRDAFAGSGRG